MLNFLARILAPAEATAAKVKSAASGAPPEAPELADGPCQVIRNPRQIERVLQGLIQMRHPVTLAARGQAKTFQTRLKAADASGGEILIRQLWNDAEHASLLADGRVNLSAEHQGSPILFTLDVVGTADHEGSPCYRLPFPDWMLSMEMRDSLRIRLPEHLHPRLHCKVSDGTPVAARVVDISEGGVRFLASMDIAERLSVGMQLDEANLYTAKGASLALQLVVRHLGGRSGDGILVGTSVAAASETHLQGLRRLILSHQRSTLRLD